MSLTPFSFVEGALDRADHLRGDAEALLALWPQAQVIVLDADGRAFADAGRDFLAFDAAVLGHGPGIMTLLGLRDGQAWFFADAATLDASAPERIDLRRAAAQWPAWQATLFAQARALQHWHQRHRHCSACGGALRFVRAGWLGVCQACKSEHYPRTDQAVIVAVTDGQRLLLGRQASWPPRRWSVVAGFVEPGETLEQTVVREVHEETGVRVHADSARYVASQPWPFPGSLMLGFTALAHADAPRAQEELEDVRWFERAQVLAALQDRDAQLRLSPPLSISRWLIQTWAEGIGA